MSLIQDLSVLVVKQVLADRANSLLGFLGDRFSNKTRRLEQALHTANDRAWKALELALAGSSWWASLKGMVTSREEQAMVGDIQTYLASVAVQSLPGESESFRKLSLSELRSARRVGLVPGSAFSAHDVASEAQIFARYGERQQVIAHERRMLEGIAGALQKEGYGNLARCVSLRPGDGDPLLVQAARHFFRRYVESDRELSAGLTLESLEGISATQKAGFDTLEGALTRQGKRVEELLDGLAGQVAETHQDVKAVRADVEHIREHLEIATGSRDDIKTMRTQMEQQSEQIRLLSDMLRGLLEQRSATPAAPQPAAPQHTAPARPVVPVVLSTPPPVADTTPAPAPSEWEHVRQLLARAKRITPEEQRHQPELARVVDQLTEAALSFETTRRTVQNLEHSTSNAPLPVYPQEPAILDALPVDERPPLTEPPISARGKRLISPLFLQQANQATPPPAPETPATPEQPPATKPGRRRLISPLFDPKPDKQGG